MTSFARFYSLQLNIYDVISDVTDRLKKSDNTFLKRLSKYSISSITIQFNVKTKQVIKISPKHALQNAVAMATSDPITKILPHHHIAR